MEPVPARHLSKRRALRRLHIGQAHGTPRVLVARARSPDDARQARHRVGVRGEKNVRVSSSAMLTSPPKKASAVGTRLDARESSLPAGIEPPSWNDAVPPAESPKGLATYSVRDGKFRPRAPSSALHASRPPSRSQSRRSRRKRRRRACRPRPPGGARSAAWRRRRHRERRPRRARCACPRPGAAPPPPRMSRRTASTSDPSRTKARTRGGGRLPRSRGTTCPAAPPRVRRRPVPTQCAPPEGPSPRAPPSRRPTRRGECRGRRPSRAFVFRLRSVSKEKSSPYKVIATREREEREERFRFYSSAAAARSATSRETSPSLRTSPFASSGSAPSAETSLSASPRASAAATRAAAARDAEGKRPPSFFLSSRSLLRRRRPRRDAAVPPAPPRRRGFPFPARASLPARRAQPPPRSRRLARRARPPPRPPFAGARREQRLRRAPREDQTRRRAPWLASRPARRRSRRRFSRKPRHHHESWVVR